MLSKLQAVNLILRRLGKPVVGETDAGGGSTHAYVERTLDDAVEMIQQEGWHWNTKYNVETTAADDGYINVSQLEVASLDSAGDPATYYDIYHVDVEPSAAIDTVRKGEHLWNLTDQEFVTSTVKLRYTHAVSFDETPVSFQKWAIALATFNFNRYYWNKPNLDGALQIELAETRRQATREEIRTLDVNILDTREMRQIRGRPRTMDRSV